MRILFFIHSLSSGGAERVTANLANHWAAKGWEVFIVTLASQELDFYDLHPRVQRITLGLAGESRNAAVGMWNNLRRIYALRRVLRRVRPQVAVAMMTTANVLLAIAAWGLSNLLCVGSERIHPPQMPTGQPWEMLRRYLYRSLDSVVTLTTESAAWLRANTLAHRVVVIPNAVPWPFPVQEPVLPVERYVSNVRRILLAVGRLDKQKGFDLLLKAFSIIADDHSDWDLVILGEGPLRSHLESQVQELELVGRVMLPGRVGNIRDWYRRADLYVMSSLFEGFPNTLVEALVHGTAAVSYDCDTGPRDIIRHEVDGLLVPAGDVAKLADALDRLMGDRELRQQYALRAVEARERFSIERVAGMWEALFNG